MEPCYLDWENMHPGIPYWSKASLFYVAFHRYAAFDFWGYFLTAVFISYFLEMKFITITLLN